MKKTLWIWVTIMLVAFLGVLLLRPEKINMEAVKEVEANFAYGETEVSQLLNEKDIELLKNIFDGKKTYNDNPSCGFSETVSIKFNQEQTFCIARDTCPIIYWKEKNKYIRLSEGEKTQLYSMLEPYGFFFPCV